MAIGNHLILPYTGHTWGMVAHGFSLEYRLERREELVCCTVLLNVDALQVHDFNCITFVVSGAGIATRYGLGGPGIESRWGRDFSQPSRPAMGVKRLWRGVDHPPPSSARVKERVELYLCFPSGPSWHVLGRTLPFTFTFVVIVCLVVACGCDCVLVESLRHSLSCRDFALKETVIYISRPAPFLTKMVEHFDNRLCHLLILATKLILGCVVLRKHHCIFSLVSYPTERFGQQMVLVLSLLCVRQ
jgi:hypothetical protein